MREIKEEVAAVPFTLTQGSALSERDPSSFWFQESIPVWITVRGRTLVLLLVDPILPLHGSVFSAALRGSQSRDCYITD